MKKNNIVFVLIFCVLTFACNFVYADEEIVGVCESEYQKEVERVSALVTPSTVYAKVLNNVSGLQKGDVVEIIRDKDSGKKYNVRKDDKTYWISSGYLSIPKDPPTNEEQMTKDDIELYINSKDMTSDTSYLIWVDVNRQVLHTFLGENGNWNLIKTVSCATGRNRTPTVRGVFKVYVTGKLAYVKGDCWVKNYIRFHDVYMIHSNPVNGRGKIIDYTMGRRVSNGCVRTNMSDSEWLVYYIPVATTVFVS
ncbi:MAG: L,D-transpeptidase family protein [Clostridiales bacterium]|nr:L,D-transpeptidase family protein [Clostridiales bacterium]